jgi:hypothetical protein
LGLGCTRHHAFELILLSGSRTRSKDEESLFLMFAAMTPVSMTTILYLMRPFKVHAATEM